MKILLHVIKIWIPIAIAETLAAWWYLPERSLIYSDADWLADFIKAWPLIFFPAVIVDYLGHRKLLLSLVVFISIVILSSILFIGIWYWAAIFIEPRLFYGMDYNPS